MSTPQPACIDSLDLARFIDGALTGEARERVVEHLAECDECRELVAESAAIRDESPVIVVPENSWRRPLILSVSLLAAAAAIALVAWLPLRLQVRPDEYQRLVVAVGTFRTVEARLTGGFAYGPLRAPVRGGPQGNPENLELLSAAAALQSAATATPSAANLRAAGVAYLLLGTYDEAIRALELSVKLAPDDGRASSDLAAAYLARASRSNAPADYARGADSAQQAITSDPTLVEPYFNLALCLEYMSLIEPARRAWQEYLTRDGNSDWAAEANRHLSGLGRAADASIDLHSRLAAALVAGDDRTIGALAGAYPLSVRDYLYDNVLTEWADAVNGGEDTLSAANAAARLSRALETGVDDRFASEVVNWVLHVGEGRAAAALAQLHREYAEARRLLAADQPGAAMPLFRSCAAAANVMRHPLALVCGYQATTSALNAGGQSESFDALGAIVAEAGRRNFCGLAGAALWRRALIRTNRGDLGGALAEYRRALEFYERSGEADNVANIHSLMSETLRSVGDLDNAWREHAAALRLSASLWTPRVRHQILVQVVLTGLEARLPRMALFAVEELVAEDTAWQHAGSLALARAHYARVLSRIGRASEARDALAAAYSGLNTIPDRDYQRRFETEVRLAEVEVNEADAPEAVITAATHAIDNLRHINAYGRLPGFLFARARAAAKRGDNATAEADFRDAVTTLNIAQEQLRGDVLQISHLERNFALIRNLAEFELTIKGNATRALEHLEQSRARWLLTQVGRAEGPVRPATIAARVPPDTAIIFYGCLGETLHAWVLTTGSIVYQPLGEVSELRRGVERVWTAMQSRQSGEIPELSELYLVLMQPLTAAIGGRTRLIVVPDGPIFNVPLGALREPASGRYLVEDVSLEVAPSLSLITFAASSAPPISSVGIFGGTSGEAFLKAVAEEQRAVASAYSLASVRQYTGDKAEFMSEVSKHEVVHFAGHAIANAIDPGMSLLQFPGDENEPGAGLLAAELVGLHLQRVQVVVLAACRTAWGRTVAGEGTLSLAHAFQAAGAHAVVASLWDVDDSTTRQLIGFLHREIAAGYPVRDALRQAQLQAIRSNVPALREPSAWAAFMTSVS